MPPHDGWDAPRAAARRALLRRAESPRRGPHRLDRGEQGNAVVEFIFLVTLLLVPVVYLVLAVANLQAGAFASAGAADQAAKVFATAESMEAGQSRAEGAVLLALTDFGFEPSAATLSISCQPACLEPGSLVTVEVDLAVQLPLIPISNPLSLSAATLSASATEAVARFG